MAAQRPLALKVFEGAAAGAREVGLAYATVALARNDVTAAMTAKEKLETAWKQDPRDAKVAVQLAQILDHMHREREACELYREALRLDPGATAARINSATCAANRGDLAEAIRGLETRPCRCTWRRSGAIQSCGSALSLRGSGGGDQDVGGGPEIRPAFRASAGDGR